MYSLLLLNFIVSFVMLLVGWLLKKNPVTDMSSHNGYNTPASRKSQRHWDYAQRIAPDIFVGFGIRSAIAEIILNILLLLFHVSIPVSVISGTVIGFVFLFLGFRETESRIKREFGG